MDFNNEEGQITDEGQQCYHWTHSLSADPFAPILTYVYLPFQLHFSHSEPHPWLPFPILMMDLPLQRGMPSWNIWRVSFSDALAAIPSRWHAVLWHVPITGEDEEESGVNYTQQVVIKYRKGKEGKKRAAQLKEAREEQRLRKTVIPMEATGLKAAIHEWARALLGLPRQSSSPTPSSSSSTLTKHLEQHLPVAASEAEVEAWTKHSTRRSNFIDDSVKKEMTRLLLSNPRATDAAKHELKKKVTKQIVEAYEKSHPAVRFRSSVAKATASVVTYDSSRLSYAEAALSQCGFPRLTFQWGSALSSSWNQATINSLVASWLDCYNARGVPASFIIDESILEVPRLAKEILMTWVQHKRQLYSTQSKEKILISQAGGAAKLEKKLMSDKDTRSMNALRKKVC